MSETTSDPAEPTQEELPPSRTARSKQRKSDETRLANLAASLVGMSNRQLAKLVLDDSVMVELVEARRMKAHAARARQLRQVRRALRDADHVTIAREVADVLNPDGAPSPATRKAERWVDRLLEEGHSALGVFVQEHPDADRQQLGNLLRNLRKTKESQRAKTRKTLRLKVEQLMASRPE